MHIPQSVFEAAIYEPQVWEDDRGFVYLLQWDETQARVLAGVVSRPNRTDPEWPEESEA